MRVPLRGSIRAAIKIHDNGALIILVELGIL